jgi:hypothetical protein
MHYFNIPVLYLLSRGPKIGGWGQWTYQDRTRPVAPPPAVYVIQPVPRDPSDLGFLSLPLWNDVRVTYRARGKLQSAEHARRFFFLFSTFNLHWWCSFIVHGKVIALHTSGLCNAVCFYCRLLSVSFASRVLKTYAGYVLRCCNLRAIFWAVFVTSRTSDIL